MSKKIYLKVCVTHNTKGSISGFSYKMDYSNEAIAGQTRKFGKPQIIVGTFLQQLEKWLKPGLD